MKVYTYKQEEVGGAKLSEGMIRLEGVEKTEDPKQADLFIIPVSLNNLDPRVARMLPYMKGKEERHIGFDISDDSRVFNLKSIFIRCNLKANMLKADPNSLGWAWPVENWKDLVDLPEGGFKYDISFIGWNSSWIRKQSILSCLENSKLKCDITTYEEFFGYVERDNPQLAKERKDKHRRSLQESKLALCSSSIPGDLPYRFYEAMSAGRVPIGFCSGCVLPFPHEIPWNEFSYIFSENQSSGAGHLIQKILEKNSTEDLIKKGRLARHFWELYLDRDIWHRSMKEAVVKKLN